MVYRIYGGFSMSSGAYRTNQQKSEAGNTTIGLSWLNRYPGHFWHI